MITSLLNLSIGHLAVAGFMETVLSVFFSVLSLILILGFLAFVAVIGAIAFIIGRVVNKYRKTPNFTKIVVMPSELSQSLKAIKKVYAKDNLPGKSARKRIKKTLNLFGELTEAMDFMKLSSHKREMIYVEYSNVITKLSNILGERYYLDIRKNPSHWSEPKKRIEDINKTLSAVDQQILESIQQIKAGVEIDVDVSIESILANQAIDYKAMLQ